jgi:Fuc2NAc and GlcNAc transferase
VFAIGAGITVAALCGAGHVHWSILAGASMIAFTGAADDLLGGIPAAIRLVVQSAAAALVVWFAGGLMAAPLPAPLTVPLGVAGPLCSLVWIIAVTNIFNFLDGVDGFAGTQAVLGGSAIAIIASDISIATTGIAIAGAAAGFLAHNWRPARIFLGDSGSTTIGFLLAVLPFEAKPDVRPQLVFATILFLWFFLSDGVFTLIRRLLRGDRIWEPHRTHLYQVIARAGIAHDVVVIRVMGMAVIVAGVAIVSARAENAMYGWISLLLALLLFGAYFCWSERVRG